MLLVVAFFLIGALIGGQINHAIYRFAFFNNPPYSPWMKPHPEAAKRTFIDYIPILGWCFLNREEKIHGSLFWLRPFLIEVFSGCALAGLYLYHIDGSGLVPETGQIPESVRWSWLAAHTVLLTLLTIATFVDFDEFMIPDQSTIPGVLFFILFAAIYPSVALPSLDDDTKLFVPLGYASPLHPPVVLFGITGLLCALGCLWFWCFALIPKVCTFRKGLANFFPLMMASILQRPRSTHGTIEIAPRKMYWGTPVLAGIALIGTIAIPVFWLVFATDDQKSGLLSSIFGMAFGMSMIWSIRIIGRTALGKEAMGFGDVTLMAMIGAYVGWQACLPILASSAIIALLISVPMAAIKSESVLPYGPYLSMGTVAVVFGWYEIWENWMKDVFERIRPEYIFMIFVIMTVPMYILLLITRFVKERLIGIQ